MDMKCFINCEILHEYEQISLLLTIHQPSGNSFWICESIVYENRNEVGLLEEEDHEKVNETSWQEVIS